MKRLLSSVALLIISSFICLAQTDESRHEIAVSYGYITLPQAIDFISVAGATVLGGLFVGIVDVLTPEDQEYPKRIDNGGTGGFSFQYLYSLHRKINWEELFAMKALGANGVTEVATLYIILQ